MIKPASLDFQHPANNKHSIGVGSLQDDTGVSLLGDRTIPWALNFYSQWNAYYMPTVLYIAGEYDHTLGCLQATGPS